MAKAPFPATDTSFLPSASLSDTASGATAAGVEDSMASTKKLESIKTRVRALATGLVRSARAFSEAVSPTRAFSPSVRPARAFLDAVSTERVTPVEAIGTRVAAIRSRTITRLRALREPPKSPTTTPE